MVSPPGPVPRAVCRRCRRPTSVCYCQHLASIPTRTRVVLLQHPRERKVAIGTAHMASLCLPESELHVGVDWSTSAELARALSDPTRPPALLFPGEGAIDIGVAPPAGPVTLVVVDGTWSQAAKVVRHNPVLKALPRYTFTAKTPSEYRIRREPSARHVSTLEALVHALGFLEGDPARFQGLLAPFRAMVDAQIAAEARHRGARLRHRRKAPPKPPTLPASLVGRRANLVCVTAEANAWPYRNGERGASYPDELVHLAATRPATGESFDVITRPQHPLAPATPGHVELSASDILGGTSLDDLRAQWRAFLRPGDLLCTWGTYALTLLASWDIALPEHRVDLRRIVRVLTNQKLGSLDDVEAHFRGGPGALVDAGAPVNAGVLGSPGEAPPRGRARRRLRQLVAVQSELFVRYASVTS